MQLQFEKQETLNPKLNRQMDLAMTNALAIHAKTPAIVVEGNYLLLKSGFWLSPRDVFTATDFIYPSVNDHETGCIKDHLVAHKCEI
jgi:pantothenate kinase